jgi:hypothetical protein
LRRQFSESTRLLAHQNLHDELQSKFLLTAQSLLNFVGRFRSQLKCAILPRKVSRFVKLRERNTKLENKAKTIARFARNSKKGV